MSNAPWTLAIAEGSNLKVQSIYLPLNHLFNQASKRAFEISVKQVPPPPRKLTFITDTRGIAIDEVRFFGAKAVGERQIFDAAQKVANLVNEYASKGFVTAELQKLLLVQLVTEPHQLEEYLVLSYVALSEQGIQYLTKNPTNLEFAQGSVPAETVKSTA